MIGRFWTWFKLRVELSYWRGYASANPTIDEEDLWILNGRIVELERKLNSGS